MKRPAILLLSILCTIAAARAASPTQLLAELETTVAN
jgi:hypothetical protein